MKIHCVKEGSSRGSSEGKTLKSVFCKFIKIFHPSYLPQTDPFSLVDPIHAIIVEVDCVLSASPSLFFSKSSVKTT